LDNVELTKEELAYLVRGGSPNDKSSDRPSPFSEGESHPSPSAESATEDLQHLLTGVWQDFALRWSSVLTKRLRIECEVEVSSIDQTTYGGFIFALDHPTCLQVIKAEGLAAPLLIEQHPSLLFPLLDRLLGGGSLPSAVLRRPLTDLESRLVKSITGDMLKEVTAAWSQVVPLQLSLQQMESNPKLVRVALPGDDWFVSVLKISFGDNVGRLRVGLSKSSVENVFLQVVNSVSPLEHGEGNEAVQLQVTLAETTLKRESLMDLRVGDILKTDTDESESATLRMDGVPRFLVVPGVRSGRKAIQIESIY